MTEFVADRQIYEKVIRVPVPLAQERLWIATADIKDMYVEKRAGAPRRWCRFCRFCRSCCGEMSRSG